MRAGIYARIRYEDALDLPMQVEALEAFVRLKGWTIVLREAETEQKPSGRLPAREGLLHAAKNGQIDVIVVWKVDRFARSLAEFACIVETLHAQNVSFASLADDFDLSGSQGPLLRRVLRVLNNLQRQSQRDQVQVGIQRARKAGQPIGRPSKAKAKMEEAQRFAKEGLSNREIAQRLGVHPRTVGRLLMASKESKRSARGPEGDAEVRGTMTQ